MALFIKKGINKKKGDFVYPEPTQTNTGNCAAYAGAACLYAFGLDHESGLIPTLPDGTPSEQFQLQIQRMVERLTDLIYTQKNGVAEGYRKYLEEKGLKDKFEVTEFSGDGEYTLPDGKKESNWIYALKELKRCQDIIPFIKWDVPDKKKEVARHAVTLVGIDEATGEAIIANPWGKPSGCTNVPPNEAGQNTVNGNPNRSHTRYKFTVTGNGIEVEFDGHKAVIYNFVKICPVSIPAVTLSMNIEHSIKFPGGGIGESYAYALRNNNFQPINALAVRLPGINPSDILQMSGPSGWSCAHWYYDREKHFYFFAPDQQEPVPGTFAGIIWRTHKQKQIKQKQTQDGFSFTLRKPITDIDETALSQEISENVIGNQILNITNRFKDVIKGIETWKLKGGHAVALSESIKGMHAVHFGVDVPFKYCTTGEALEILLKSFEPRLSDVVHSNADQRINKGIHKDSKKRKRNTDTLKKNK